MLKLALILTFTLLFSAATKQRAWQTGTIEATTEQREFSGTTTMTPPTVYGPRMSASGASYNTWLGYGIHTATMDYLVRYLLPVGNLIRKPGTRPNVTVHGPVKFAVEKTLLYFVDEDGVEYKTLIMEKRLLEPKPGEVK